MADRTGIEWTDATWNPIRGCSRVSEGCRHCYQVEWRELRANQYGAATIRKRLFLIARCDGLPIVWPEPTHLPAGSPEVKAKQAKPQRLAADIIDWSLPCPSIFTRKKPLAEATLRRIARGIQRYVIDAAEPFLVKVNHGYDYFRGQPLDEPLQTITSKLGTGVVVPTLVQLGYGERPGQAPRAPGLDKPLGTVVAGGGKHGLVAAFLAKHYGGNYTGPGAPLDAPAPTVTTVDHNALVTSHLVKLRNNCIGQDVREPIHTLTTGGHMGEVRAFLLKYYDTAVGQALDEPLHTITTKHRLGLVMVKGEPYQIVDIGMRMLEPHELYAAQGFPANYIHDRTIGGKRLSKASQVRMCGNSVCPPVAAALVRANLVDVQRSEVAA